MTTLGLSQEGDIGRRRAYREWQGRVGGITYSNKHKHSPSALQSSRGQLNPGSELTEETV